MRYSQAQLSFEQEYRSKVLARRTDPETSRRVARKMVESGKLNKQQQAVIRIIRRYCEDHKDFTPFDLAGGERNNLYYSIQRRKNELAVKGYIKKTGEVRNDNDVLKLL